MMIASRPLKPPFTNVVGRFAPSPSGPLHFGSLVAALGSYLSAKHQGGRWLVRIEDIDPPREPVGAANTILQQLTDFGFQWDQPLWYQSQRQARYDEILSQLIENKQAFYCACNRQQLQANEGRCAQGCGERTFQSDIATAIRLHAPATELQFFDRLHGQIRHTRGDEPVLKRRDGLYGYTLAVVVDDMDQGITEVVRGADLLPATAAQVHLMQTLGHTPPQYAHLPLVVQSDGRKLSKQNHAPAIDSAQAIFLLNRALNVLGQATYDTQSKADLLRLAVEHWQPLAVRNTPIQAESPL